MGKLRIALIVSVILNLFLAGALVAGIVSVRSGSRMINAGSLRNVAFVPKQTFPCRLMPPYIGLTFFTLRTTPS